MTLTEQYTQHKDEFISNQAQQHELEKRNVELRVIIQALEVGVKREDELLKELDQLQPDSKAD